MQFTDTATLQADLQAVSQTLAEQKAWNAGLEMNIASLLELLNGIDGRLYAAECAIPDQAAPLTPPAPAVAPETVAALEMRVQQLEAAKLGQDANNLSRDQNNENLLGMLSDLAQRIYQLRSEFSNVARQDRPIGDLMNAARLEERIALMSALQARKKVSGKPVDPMKAAKSRLSLSRQEDKLREQAPKTWEAYAKAAKEAAIAYGGEPSCHLSVEDNRASHDFGKFIAPFLGGRVLDIGCGPQKRPTYLKGVPSDGLYGIDPLPASDSHDFNFTQAYAEYLPFKDDSFDVVILGTTLDHFFNFDQALDEITRVLKPGGHVLSWISVHDDAVPYGHPKDWSGYDDGEHLYHIAPGWLAEKMTARELTSLEEMRFSHPFNYAFMTHRLDTKQPVVEPKKPKPASPKSKPAKAKPAKAETAARKVPAKTETTSTPRNAGQRDLMK